MRVNAPTPLGLGLNSEQDALRRTVRSFLTENSTESRVREVMVQAEGMDDHVWRGLAEQVGCHGLNIPEEWGGAGVTHIEQGVVFEELGRSLACIPYFSTIGLALNILLRADQGDRHVSEILGKIAAGELAATLALCEPGQNWDLHRVQMPALKNGSNWSLTGTKTYVPDGQLADVLLIVARAGTSTEVFVVDAGSSGVQVTPLPTLDQTRRQAQVTLTHASAFRLDLGPDPEDQLQRALSQAAAFLSIEQVGTAGRILDGTLEHVKTRVQFDKPVGSFQAVKHRMADMLLDVEAARSAAYYAVFAAAADDSELHQAASLAKAFCSDALTRVAESSMQLHGGIGLTWEHWAHLYFKRAKSSSILLGSPESHRERLLRQLRF